MANTLSLTSHIDSPKPDGVQRLNFVAYRKYTGGALLNIGPAALARRQALAVAKRTAARSRNGAGTFSTA